MDTLPVIQAAPLMAFLQASFPDLTRTEVKRFLKFEAVLVNGRTQTRFDHRLKPGDQVRVLTKGESRGLSGLGNARIVYEDDAILVADKPPGLLTVATEKEREKTLYYRLMHYLREKTKGRERVFIVHRLDREVSGLLVFAKSESAKLKLQRNWDRFEKYYVAVVEGAPAETSGEVRSYLSEDKLGNVTSSDRPSRDCREAVTRYQVVGSSGRYTLVEIALGTGRKHQIRVHMADLGCPVAGDDKYGAQSDPIRRLALHAGWLAIDHPVTGKRVSWELPVPGPFKALVSARPTSRRS